MPDYIVNAVIGSGPIGVVLVLILLGQLVPKAQHSWAVQRGDEWRDAYEKEREAHQHTREALAASEARTDAATEAARTAKALLDAMGHPASGGTR